MRTNGLFSLIALICLLHAPCLLADPSALQSAEKADAPVALSAQQDARLNTPLTLHIFCDTVADVLKQASALTDVSIQADTDLANRHVFLQVEKLSLLKFMEGLAWTVRGSWRRVGKADQPRYVLYLTNEERAREAIQLADAKRFQENLYRSIRDAELQALQQVMRDQPKSPLCQMIMGLTQEELEAVAGLSTSSLPMIVVGGDNYLYNHIFGATPISSLPVDMQQKLLFTDVVPRGGAAVDWGKAYLGLMAVNGAVGLCVITPNGQVGGHIGGGIFYGSVPGAANIPDPYGDSDPETNAVLGQATVEFDEALPARFQTPFLTFPPRLDRMFLPHILLRIHQQSGLPLFCDDFAASRLCRFPHLLTDEEHYTILEALSETAKAFGHQFLYHQGMLLGRTVVLGRDLRDEPPEPLRKRLCLWKTKQEALDLPDLQQLGQLSANQWYYLWDQRVAESLQASTQADWSGVAMLVAEGPLWNLTVLHLLASLSPSQLQEAKSAEGLPYERLTKAQRSQLALAVDVGLPTFPAKRKAGLYLHALRWPTGALHTLEVILVSHGRTSKMRVCGFVVNATPVGGYSGSVY